MIQRDVRVLTWRGIRTCRRVNEYESHDEAEEVELEWVVRPVQQGLAWDDVRVVDLRLEVQTYDQELLNVTEILELLNLTEILRVKDPDSSE